MTINLAKALTLVTLVAATTIGTGSVVPADAGQVVVSKVGNRTFYADGTVEVEVEAGTLSLSQCESGQFCVWSQANYLGSFRYKTGTGAKTLGGTVGSFWNN